MLRIPSAYRDGLRELADRHDTSAGGAVMLLIEALLEMRELAARHSSSAGSAVMSLLDAKLRELIPPAGLKALR